MSYAFITTLSMSPLLPHETRINGVRSPTTPPDVPGAACIHQVSPSHPLVIYILNFRVLRAILRAKYSQSKYKLLSVVEGNG